MNILQCCCVCFLLVGLGVGGSAFAGGDGGGDPREWTKFIPTEEPCPRNVDFVPFLDQLEDDLKRLRKTRNRLVSLAGDISPSPVSLGPNPATTGRDLYGLYDDLFGPCK